MFFHYNSVKKGHSQHRTIELSNPAFNDKLESLLRFSIPLYSVEELKMELDEVYVIDAREENEFNTSHIPGAHYGGYKNFDINDFDHLSKDHKNCALLLSGISK